jgi:hypothetical protein
MADVITRFKLETTQYDSKLRDASKGLAEYARTASLAGKEFDKFTKNNVAAAKAFGSIETSATNAKDKVKELVGAYNDMARAYNSLTKDQQQSDWAKAMAQSLQQLQVRIKEAKQEMYGLNAAANNMKTPNGGIGGGGGFGGMLQVFGGNLMTKASGMMVGLAQNMGDVIQRGSQLATTAEGIRMAFDRINKPGLLDNLKEATHGTISELELMKAAVRFNDFNLSVEDLGTYLAFAQQKAKDTGQSIEYLTESIVMGLGRNSVQILDNLGISAKEIRERMKDGGDMTKAVAEIIREQMENAGDYVETAAERIAKSEADLENATLHLGIAMREAFGYEGIEQMSNVIETTIIKDFTTLTDVIGIFTRKMQQMGVDTNRVLESLGHQAYLLMAGPFGALLTMTGNSLKNYAVNGGTGATGGHIIKRNTAGGGGGGGTTTPRGGRNTKIEEIVPVGSVRDLTNQLQDLQKAQQLVTNPEDWQQYQQKIDDLTKRINTLKGKVEEVDLDKLFPFKSVDGGSTMSIGESMASGIMQEFAQGIQDADVTALRSILQVVIENGLEGIDIPSDSIMEQIFGDGADIPDETWQKFIDQINEKLKEKGIDPIQLDFATGKTGKKKEENEEKKYLSEGLSKLGGGLSGLQSGFEMLGIDLGDGFKDVVNGIQGISTILSAIMTIVSAIEVIAGTDALIPFANGGVVHAANGWSGVVPGNMMSGDNVPALLNSQEVVLNASQQSMLANNLQNNGGGSVHVTGILRGEDIVLIADRWGRRTGKGELLFGKNL